MNNENGTEAARILVVDDEPHVLEVVRAELERAGYVVETVGDGETALSRMTTVLPDLLVIDAYMPGMEGFALLDAVREEETLRDLPIILMIGKAAIGGVRRHHADNYITKPFNPKELLSYIKRLLSTGSSKIVYELARPPDR